MRKAQEEPAREEALSELYAGTVEDVRLSLPLHRAVLTVRTFASAGKDPAKADRRIVSWHEVAFEGVTSFTFADTLGSTGPWAVVEVTETLRLDRDGRTE